MVRYLTAVFSALLIGWSVFPSAAQAQTICGERGAIVASLEKTYAHCATIVGNWEEPSGESRCNAVQG